MEAFNKKVELIKLYLAVAMCVFGCCLLVAGFLVAPTGIIDNSVLVAFGEVCTFAGALIGINYLYSAKHKELEMNIENKIKDKFNENR